GGVGSARRQSAAGQGDEDIRPLDLLTALVEKSLLARERRPDGATRLRMLETLREYAWERLVARDEADDARRWQTRHYLGRAEAMERLPYPACATERERFDDELENVRAALRWALASPHPADVELGLRLAAELGQFWYAAGHISEGCVFLHGLLARVARDNRCRATAIHAKAHHMAGWLALDQGECVRAVEHLSRSVDLYRQTDDPIGLANALNRLGDAALQADDDELARRVFSESLDLRGRAGDELATAASLNNLGAVATQAGDNDEAEARFSEALAVYRRHDDIWGVSFVYGNLGELARRRGDLTRAAQLYDDALITVRERGTSADEAWLLGGLAEVAQARGDREWSASLWRESLAIQRRLGNRYAIATCELSLGRLACESGHLAEALAFYGESLRAFHRLAVTKGMLLCVTGLAAVARDSGDMERAARLCGGVAALRETLRIRYADDSRLHEQTVTAVRATLGERRFLAAWDAGRAAAHDEGAAFALDTPEHPQVRLGCGEVFTPCPPRPTGREGT
ncbi:MAG: tetratricopeptide repeat protein, partial [Ktedonobacterales bacterium]